MTPRDFIDYGTQFTESKNITYGNTSLQVYPQLESDMSPAEKVYGYLFTKSTLESADLVIRTKLQAFRDLTNMNPLMPIISTLYMI